MAKNIQLIIGSTRKNRIADSIAQWVQSQAAKNDNINLEVIDLQTEDLPFFSSATPPSASPDTSEAGKAWADKIGSADGYIFLTPEYNRSIPASLKNALDYLVAEWKEKPAAIVSYGWIDGGQSATDHLKDILNWLKLDLSPINIALPLSGDILDETGQIADADVAFARHQTDFETLTQDLEK